MLGQKSCISEEFNLCPSQGSGGLKKPVCPLTTYSVKQLKRGEETPHPSTPHSLQLRPGVQIKCCVGSHRQQSGSEAKAVGCRAGRMRSWWCMWNDIPDAQACCITEGNARLPRQGRCQTVDWELQGLIWSWDVGCLSNDSIEAKMGMFSSPSISFSFFCFVSHRLEL